METYRGTVTDNTGRPVAGATVTVYLTGTSTTADLYNEAGTAGIANPLTTDANGYYVFSAADDTYDIAFSGSGVVGATHSRVKLWDFATASAAPFSQVSLAMPAEFSVSGSPAGAAGTITVGKATQTANKVYASATSGGAAQPAFRALVNADLPASGVSAATYGTATKSAAVVVNAQGVITSASEITIAPTFANVASKPTTVAGYGITDGHRVLWVQTADQTIGNTGAETTMLGTGEGTLVFAGNTAAVGTIIRITLEGTMAVASSETIRVICKLGAYDLLDETSGTITAAATSAFRLSYTLVYRAIGATGTVQATGTLLANGDDEWMQDFVASPTSTTVNTTIDGTLNVTLTHSVANAGNTVTVNNVIVEVLRG